MVANQRQTFVAFSDRTSVQAEDRRSRGLESLPQKAEVLPLAAHDDLRLRQMGLNLLPIHLEYEVLMMSCVEVGLVEGQVGVGRSQQFLICAYSRRHTLRHSQDEATECLWT